MRAKARRWTYELGFRARYGQQTVTVPDQVAADQYGFGERDEAFRAITGGGRYVRLRIDVDRNGIQPVPSGALLVVNGSDA